MLVAVVLGFVQSAPAEQPTVLQRFLTQLSPGPENQVCFTDSEGRRHFCPAGATCCKQAKSGCCAAGAFCTDYGCAMPMQCSVCSDGLRRSVQLRVNIARGLRTYVNNEIARYNNCKKTTSGDCTAGDLLVRSLVNCTGMFGEEAPLQACVSRLLPAKP